jgi:hypothetical protein
MKKLAVTVTCLEDLRFWMSSIAYRRFEWLDAWVTLLETRKGISRGTA